MGGIKEKRFIMIRYNILLKSENNEEWVITFIKPNKSIFLNFTLEMFKGAY